MPPDCTDRHQLIKEHLKLPIRAAHKWIFWSCLSKNQKTKSQRTQFRGNKKKFPPIIFPPLSELSSSLRREEVGKKGRGITKNKTKKKILAYQSLKVTERMTIFSSPPFSSAAYHFLAGSSSPDILSPLSG